MKILIWTGGALETWGPRSIADGGVGGSETAAIRISEQLARRGHHVEIWGRVTPTTIVPEGGGSVHYVEASGKCPGGLSEIDCDVFISSRELDALSVLRPRCRLSVLWMHDSHAGEDWQDLMGDHDVVFCLSRWARGHLMGHYPQVPEDKFVVTRNGVEPTLFLRSGEDPSHHVDPALKIGHKFIYSSSPDRGLGRLLGMWPAIRDEIPDAELHVYYGFDNLRAWHALRPALGELGKMVQVDYLEHRLDDLRASGVHHHGRVGQPDLARAFMESLLWLYPTSFCETSCITALEAQAAGCWPVTSRIGALPETVRAGTLVDDPQEAAYDKIFVRKVVEYVDDVDACRTQSSSCRWGNRRRVLAECSWQSIAIEWERLFDERLGARG